MIVSWQSRRTPGPSSGPRRHTHVLVVVVLRGRGGGAHGGEVLAGSPVAGVIFLIFRGDPVERRGRGAVRSEGPCTHIPARLSGGQSQGRPRGVVPLGVVVGWLPRRPFVIVVVVLAGPGEGPRDARRVGGGGCQLVNGGWLLGLRGLRGDGALGIEAAVASRCPSQTPKSRRRHHHPARTHHHTHHLLSLAAGKLSPGKIVSEEYITHTNDGTASRHLSFGLCAHIS